MVRLKYLFLAAAFFVATNLYAEDEGKGGFFEIREKLNLTEAQKAQVKEIRKNSSPFSQHKEMIQEKDKLRDLIKKDGSSEAEIFAQAEKINKLQSEANLSRVKNILAFKKILTPEQFSMLSEHMEKKREEFRDNMKEKFGKRKP